MAIVLTEIESVHGTPPQQLVFYRCKDSADVWHSYGPVIVNDAEFDKTAHKTVVAAEMEAMLAAQEFAALIGA